MDCMNQDISLHLADKERAALRDLQLVSAVLAGSSDAFAELERRYSRQLYSTIFGITRNREDSQDGLQDTFLRAYLSLPGFQGRSSFYSWVTRIAINSALMILRKRRSHPEVSFEFSAEPEGDISRFELKDPSLDPEQIYDQHQRCANIQRAIQRLQSSLRGALQTRMTHGSSLGEIAQSLDITEAAVKARLHRARTRLSATQVFRKMEKIQPASSGSQRKELIAALQNREQPCRNSSQYL